MDVLDALLAEETPLGVVCSAQSFATGMGVRSMSFAYAITEGQPAGWGTGKTAWKQSYMDEGLCQADPGYQRATGPGMPMLMHLDTGFPGLESDDMHMAFCETMRSFGNTAAMMVPDMTPRGTDEMWAVSYQTDVSEGAVTRWHKSEGDRLAFLAQAVLWRMHQLVETGRKTPALSKRERQVLDLLGQGDQFARISAKLDISEKTVEFHAARLRKRLGVRTTNEALVKAARLGLL